MARREFGLEVGRDISIVGFDNTGLSARPSFSLTTYSQPAEQLVVSTMSLLEKVMGALIVRTSARLPVDYTPTPPQAPGY